MKTHSLLISFLMLLVIMGACSSGPVMRNATGFAYEIVVTMDKADWDAPAGKAIKAELTSDIPGLPQAEPAFKITYVTPDQFNGLLTYVRNVLIVRIDKSQYTKVSLNYENNRWAKGQVVMTLTAPDDAAILEYVKAHPRNIVEFFTKCERNRTIGQLEKEHSPVVMDHVKDRFNVMLSAPANMTYFRDTTGFFWASNNANTGRTDIVVYDFPYKDADTFTADYLIAKRDSVMKLNMPGTFPGSYMATDTAWVTYNPTTVNGKYCGVLRGLWHMKGDMMGGPFVSHARLDEKNNRVVVVEGFVFAPETDKRNFIRRIESALYTLRLPGEFEETQVKVGITHGDINGIGYEVILKTLSDTRIAELCTPVIYGSSKIAAYHRKVLELPAVNLSIIAQAEDAGANRVNIINCVDDETKVELCQSTTAAGEAAYLALEAAVTDLKRGAVDVLVTAPINKHNIQNEQFHFPGHTEYLEQCFGGLGKKALMILMKDNLRVALVTGHIPLAQVASKITVEDIVSKLRIFNQSLRQDFGIVRPRIAVLALNPHAGDAGLLGKEEEEIIIPAIQEAEKKGVMSFGPYAADGFFGSQVYDKFDGVLAMYHDQGLAPFKTLAMDDGVNYTAGLSIVRTSPAHGTAYDIAGQNVASEESFRQALYAALDIYRNRIRYREATANPLRKQYFDKGGDNEKLDLTKEEDE